MTEKKSKKIVIIGPAYPYRGGNPTFITYVYFILSKRFDVKIYNYKLLYPSFLFPGTTQFDKSEVVFKKAPSERVVNSINPFNWIKVASKLQKENADLVVFNWWHPFFSFCHFTISFLIKRKFKGKILFITENFISHEGHFIDRMLTYFGLSNANIFLALSSEVENDLTRIAKGRKIYRSELPVFEYKKDETVNAESLKQNLGFEADSMILLFFGYVRKYKGLDILLESMPDIVKYNPKLKLLVLGEFYDSPEGYFNIVKKHNLESSIKIVNRFIPNEEIEQYHKISELVILPYRSATQSAILNVAYGFGKPVVATKVGGLLEFVDDGKTGILVEPESPAAIVDGIKKYFSLKDKVDFEKNIFEKVSSNTFNNLPELFEQMISEIKE